MSGALWSMGARRWNGVVTTGGALYQGKNLTIAKLLKELIKYLVPLIVFFFCHFFW